MNSISRRGLLRSAVGAFATSLPQLSFSQRADYTYELVARPAELELLPGTQTPAWLFDGIFPAPVLRARQGQPFKVIFRNELPEPTTIHWHGIRLPVEMDGVPWLTQPPIPPGATFIYEFTPPDAGTFWYHPHFNSLQQLSRGLTGVLVVQEQTPPGFDVDLVLGLKDWHLHEDGSFRAFSDPRAAARTGTLGNTPTVNGRLVPQPGHINADELPTLSVPAGANLRLRLANMDNTRVFHIAADHPATVLAREGNPLPETHPLDAHPLGAGMRVDLAMHLPQEPGTLIQIHDRKGRFDFPIARLRIEPNLRPTSAPARQPKLPTNPVPALDLDRAEPIDLVFEWSGALTPADGRGQAMPSFWTINKRAWTGAGPETLPQPLAKLALGKTYIFNLHNATPHHHPIHLHGYTFTVLSSNQRKFQPFHTDTVLMQKNERMKVAILADNPGKWMFHCHVIEHMKTGLMGYIEVV